jgi:hypothetical protein
VTAASTRSAATSAIARDQRAGSEIRDGEKRPDGVQQELEPAAVGGERGRSARRREREQTSRNYCESRFGSVAETDMVQCQARLGGSARHC